MNYQLLPFQVKSTPYHSHENDCKKEASESAMMKLYCVVNKDFLHIFHFILRIRIVIIAY